MAPQPVFSIVPIEIAQDRRLTLWHVRVLIALLSFRRKNTDTVWPSREQIAERAGMHTANVSKTTSELVSLGWLVKVGDGGRSKSSEYRITVPETVAEPASVSAAETVAAPARVSYPQTVAAAATVAESATVAGAATVKRPQTVVDSATKTVADSARGFLDEERTIKTRRGLELPEWLPPLVWADWNAYRASSKGWTKRAAQLSLRTLVQLHAEGNNPKAVIEQSIERGWTGLFPVKGERAKTVDSLMAGAV